MLEKGTEISELGTEISELGRKHKTLLSEGILLRFGRRKARDADGGRHRSCDLVIDVIVELSFSTMASSLWHREKPLGRLETRCSEARRGDAASPQGFCKGSLLSLGRLL